MHSPKYSVVVPIYGDGALAGNFCDALEETFRTYLETSSITSSGKFEDQLELLFVDDGSPDHSYEELTTLLSTRPWVRVIQLSRNFGQHVALTCGYEKARGDFVCMLNVDQEDPPQELVKLLPILERDEADLVIGLRTGRPWSLNRLTSVGFNWFLNSLTGSHSPPDAATLRVMNRRFLDSFIGLRERSRYFPGLEQWLGFRHRYVAIEQAPRTQGTSSYNLRRRMSMALEAVISFSDRPLRWVAWSGLALSLLGSLTVATLVVLKLSGAITYQAGYPSLVALILTLGGAQISVIGLASLYIGRILAEVQRRPLYLVQKELSVASSKESPAAAPSHGPVAGPRST